MSVHSDELIRARERIDGVLKQLGVDAYLFEIERRDGQWELKVECAVDQGWGNFTLTLAAGQLENEAQLLEQCRKALAACTRDARG